MVRQRTHRAIMLQDNASMALDVITKELGTMTTPTTQRRPMDRRGRQKKLVLRIKKHIWNAQDQCASSSSSISSRIGKPKLRITLKGPVTGAGVKKVTKNHAASRGNGKGKQFKENASSSATATKKECKLTLRLPKPAEHTHTPALLLPISTSTPTPLSPAPASTAQRTSASHTHQPTSSQPLPPNNQPPTSQSPQHPQLPQRTLPRTRTCNIKTSRFIPGGSHRSLKGQHMNTMHLEQPCLQPGCKSCAYWHPERIGEGEELVGRVESVTFSSGKGEGAGMCEGWAEKELSRRRPVVEALSPVDVGSHIKDQRMCEGDKEQQEDGKELEEDRGRDPRPQTRKGRAVQVQARHREPSPLALPRPILSSHPHAQSQPQPQPHPSTTTNLPPHTERKQAEYEVLLPKTLLSQVIAPKIPVKTGWRTTPRREYIAKLKFRSQEGKEVFAALVKKAGELEKVRGLERAVGQRGDGERVKGILKPKIAVKRKADAGGDEDVSASASAKKKVRFRQRLKLGFSSEEGRERFRRVVEGL